jgi:hypothetical protein
MRLIILRLSVVMVLIVAAHGAVAQSAAGGALHGQGWNNGANHQRPQAGGKSRTEQLRARSRQTTVPSRIVAPSHGNTTRLHKP